MLDKKIKVDKVREMALQILLDVKEKNAFANIVLANFLRKKNLNDVQRRFLTELVYGVVKAGDTLDFFIERYSSLRLKKIAPKILVILRLGVYQIFYLEKIPKAAACNECVQLAKKYGHKGSQSFVNAVLRAMIREPEKAALPDLSVKKNQTAKNLALVMQHPEWLAKKWIAQFGFDKAKKFFEFNNLPAVLSLRTNTLKISREELFEKLKALNMQVRLSEKVDEGILCDDLKQTSLDALKLLQDGFCFVQDESSMQVAHVLQPQPNEIIFDVCSAPGGKATHIAALMKNQGKILACDIFDEKIKKIEENAQRLGVKILTAKKIDARNIFREVNEKADRILVDAPCSGLGVLRRKADARWNKSLNEIEALPKLQLEILESASRCLKKNGVLVYSTCTTEPAENDGVVKKFLARNENFILENAYDFVKIKQKNFSKTIHLFPFEDETDGFFIARMKKIN